MKNTGKMLLFKYCIISFLLGVTAVIIQLIFFSTGNLREGIFKYFNKFNNNILLISFFIGVIIIGYLILKFTHLFQNLSIQLNLSEESNRKLDLMVKDFKFALDTSAIITVIDHSGKIKKVNGHFENFTGLKNDEITGQSLWLLPSSLQKPGVVETIQNKINQGEVWKGEIEYYKNGGILHYVLRKMI